MLNVDVEKLRKEQSKLADKVIISDSLKNVKTIGGVEQAFVDDKIISAIVVCNYKDFEIIEKKYTIIDVKINYISSFLFYREGPAVIEAYNKLDEKPDLLIVNANGILHPRRFGMASQIGVLLDVPTIGVVKKLMLGEQKDQTVYIDKEARGYGLITRKYANPIYLSPGHKISLSMSKEIIKNSTKYPHKLPEPLHLAHKYANKLRKSLVTKE